MHWFTSHIRRTVAFALAIYVFNFSIDSRDQMPEKVAEDLSFNDIESVYEFIAESVFGLEDAVEEHDEHDPEADGSIVFKHYIVHEIIWSVNAKPSFCCRDFPHVGSETTKSLLIEIDSPPPKG